MASTLTLTRKLVDLELALAGVLSVARLIQSPASRIISSNLFEGVSYGAVDIGSEFSCWMEADFVQVSRS